MKRRLHAYCCWVWQHTNHHIISNYELLINILQKSIIRILELQHSIVAIYHSSFHHQVYWKSIFGSLGGMIQLLWYIFIHFCGSHAMIMKIKRVAVTKAPFVNFSVSKIFDLAKVPVRFFELHSYLTGVAAAELRWLLSNIKVIFNSLRVCWQYWRIWKIAEPWELA